MQNDAKTIKVANVPTTIFGNFLPNKPLNRKPASGRNKMVYIKFSIVYPLNLLNILTSTDFVFLYIIAMIANPTATSAAATTIMQKTKS